jgi:hypothetical protein
MTTFNIIILILGIVLFSIGIHTKGENSIKLVIMGTLLTIVILLAIIREENKQQSVDLPEEYKELSHNSSKPDTLLGYYDNDTVYIEFTGKHRH